tara:strand:- start:1338 stop:1778 length:441 start_codon:yes stop_codon:yes gene_type:complete
MSNLVKKEEKLIKIGTDFLDYAINNTEKKGCDTVGQHCYVQCGFCKKTANNAHPLCFKHFIDKKNKKLMWKSEYPVGCSHENWDGEPWCNGCWTIVENKPACFNCIKADWGQLEMNDQNFKFMWSDKSESSINELLQMKKLMKKYM